MNDAMRFQCVIDNLVTNQQTSPTKISIHYSTYLAHTLATILSVWNVMYLGGSIVTSYLGRTKIKNNRMSDIVGRE